MTLPSPSSIRRNWWNILTWLTCPERWTPLTQCWTNKDTIFTHSLFEDMQGKSTDQVLHYLVDTLSLEIPYLDLNAAYHINLGVWSWVSIFIFGPSGWQRQHHPNLVWGNEDGAEKSESWHRTCGTTSQKRTWALWKSTQGFSWKIMHYNPWFLNSYLFTQWSRFDNRKKTWWSINKGSPIYYEDRRNFLQKGKVPDSTRHPIIVNIEASGLWWK